MRAFPLVDEKKIGQANSLKYSAIHSLRAGQTLGETFWQIGLAALQVLLFVAFIFLMALGVLH